MCNLGFLVWGAEDLDWSTVLLLSSTTLGFLWFSSLSLIILEMNQLNEKREYFVPIEEIDKVTEYLKNHKVTMDQEAHKSEL